MAVPQYCRKCGTGLPADSAFCPACGAFVSGSDNSFTDISLQPGLTDRGTGRLPPGRMLRQRYRLLQTVGRGGMGAVYVAQDTQLGDRLVAVKEMSMSRLTPQELPVAVELFQREAHLLASLQHYNLPAIHDYFGEGDRWYLVMSYIEGGTLQASLDAAPGNKLPVNEVVRIGIELCNVLDYLHNHQPQVIFRDLKPSNIMLTPKGQVFLIDFGIARHFKEGQTKDTAHFYSVGYTPPEQYGQAQTSPRSDIYSLGVTLHQMLSGHNPAIRPFQFPALQYVDPTIPVPLTRLISQMLEMNEQARPASVAEVKAQMERVFVSRRNENSEKRVVEKKERMSIERVRAAKRTASTSPIVQVSQGLWSKINSFFDKRRVVAWICFIVLSLALGGVLPAIGLPGYYIYMLWPGLLYGISVGVSAVGLIFLLKKRHPLVDILGGITLTIFVLGEDSLFTYFISYFSFDFSFAIIRTFVYLLFLLWLIVGVRFFLRSANTAGGLLLGIFLIIWAGGIPILGTYFYLYLDLAGTIISVVLGIVLGIVAIIVSLRKWHRKQRAI